MGSRRQLHRLGREYPEPSYNFLGKLRSVSAKNAHLTDAKEVEKLLALGEHIRKETEGATASAMRSMLPLLTSDTSSFVLPQEVSDFAKEVSDDDNLLRRQAQLTMPGRYIPEE